MRSRACGATATERVGRRPCDRRPEGEISNSRTIWTVHAARNGLDDRAHELDPSNVSGACPIGEYLTLSFSLATSWRPNADATAEGAHPLACTPQSRFSVVRFVSSTQRGGSRRH